MRTAIGLLLVLGGLRLALRKRPKRRSSWELRAASSCRCR